MKPYSRESHVFTVDEANACLPLVRRIVADMVTLSKELFERRTRLETLTIGRDIAVGDLYSDELIQMEAELAKDADLLRGFDKEIASLGAETGSLSEGVIDFPSQIDGRRAYLCWKFDEPDVRYWHDVGESYTDRRLLRAETVTGGVG